MFEVRVLTENDAFAENAQAELDRILIDIRSKVQDWDGSPYWQTIMDSNGNNVGSWRYNPNTL